MKDWYYLHAFVQGKGHVEENIPCQDYCDVFHHRDYSICVVSDGAGSCENSHIGSRNATILANNHFSKLIEEKKWNDEKVKVKPQEWRKLSKNGLKAISVYSA